MSALHVAAVSCFAVGVALVVLTTLASLRVRRPEDRLHFLTPATSVGTPLVCLGLGLENGWSLTTAQIALVGVLVMITGPVLASAAVRVSLQRQGKIPQESPK